MFNPLTQPSPARRPLVIAHRGASGLAPENTLLAFQLALLLGAEGVELDVRLSADGQPVVIHDARLDRTTSGRGPVSAFTAASLRRLDAGTWFARRLAARPRLRARAERALGQMHRGVARDALLGRQYVPTLAETLALLKPAGLRRVYIELKSEPASRDALVDATIQAVRQAGMQEVVALLSFDLASVRRAREVAPELRTAANFPVGRALPSARAMIAEARRAGVGEIGLHFGLATRRTVAALQAEGLDVAAWTANHPLLMRRLIARGVDSIMSNYPDRLAALVAAGGRR